MEQSIRSWDFVGISRGIWDLRDGTPPNKGKPFQTRENLSKQGNPFQTRENLSKQEKTPTNKETLFQTRETLSKQGKIFPNKEKLFQTRNPFQTRETLSKKGKHQQTRENLSSKGYLPIKCKSLQVVGVSRQGKAVVSDGGGYGVIGGGYCLLVWG